MTNGLMADGHAENLLIKTLRNADWQIRQQEGSGMADPVPRQGLSRIGS